MSTWHCIASEHNPGQDGFGQWGAAKATVPGWQKAFVSDATHIAGLRGAAIRRCGTLGIWRRSA